MGSASMSAAAEAPSAQQPQILLVDDDALIHEQLGPALSQAGCRVQSAMSGSEALQLARQTRFDLVLMDLQMPHMSGAVTARLMRASGAGAGTAPIVAMSARLTPGDDQDIKASGIQGFVKKPVGPEALRALLQRQLPQLAFVEATTPEASAPASIPPALYRKFLAAAEDLLKEVDASLGQMDGGFTALQESAHKMAGVAALLGHPELGALASKVDLDIASDGTADEDDIRGLRAALADLTET